LEGISRSKLMKDDFNFAGTKFCLIFPPYRQSEDLFFLKATKKDLGKIPPLSLCTVAAVLERYGGRVKIIDVNVSKLSLEDTLNEIIDFGPDFLGFTLSTYQFHFTLEWIKKIRRRINKPVIVGGPHARIYSRQILTHRCIDYCVLGDAEKTLPHLIYALIEKKPLSHVGGVAYRDNSEIKLNNFSLFIKNLDNVPFPSRHLIDNSRYYSLISKHKNFTAMITSRGCVFQCTFCDQHRIPYQAMKPKRVVDEMETCGKEFGVKEIDMFDGLFSLNKQRLLEICAQIKKRKLKIFWSFRTRADLIDKEVLEVLKTAGCMRIHYGVESGSPEILKNIRKNETLEHIIRAVRLTKKAGIDTFGYFMVGNHGENKATIKATSKLMLSLPLDYVQISPIYYPPYSKVYSDIVAVIKHDYWAKYTVNPGYKIDFPIIGTSFNKNQIDRIAKKMYLRFYLRFPYMFKYLLKIKSLSEVQRAFRAIYNMLKE